MNVDHPVLDVEPNIHTIDELIDAFGRSGGFMAGHLYDGVKIMEQMLADPDTTVFLSFTADLVATGLRGLLAKFVERGFADVVITTAGTLDHDLAKSMGGVYFRGTFDADDSYLLREGINRIGNVFVRKEHYGPLIEKAVHGALADVEGVVGVRELIWRIGGGVSDDSSIVKAASRSCVPIYVPGFVDGAFGTALLTLNDMRRARGKSGVLVDVIKDEREIMDIVYSSKKLGAIIVGGGISKHHVIWWSQFKDGLDYVVYVTTATEWDGSLSGARPKEAISWGKVKPTAASSFVFSDATVALPIMFSYVANKLGFRRRNLGIYPWSCSQ
ncbi:deoxyhypusine synthase [Thermocladium modestius]|uniref:deoxyhypusine synthase n=1 Tax=Thermocladium modestius TaxID=62609 RepID=UPI001664F760|nr:deoxyhypusine synthase [Thermocladium modestius]